MFVLLTRPSPRDSWTVVRQLTTDRTRDQDVWGIFVVPSRSPRGPLKITALPKLWTPGISAGEAHGVHRGSSQILALHNALSNPALTSSKTDITSWKSCGIAVVCWSAVWRWAGLCCRSARGCVEGQDLSFVCTLALSCLFYLQAVNRLLAPKSRKRSCQVCGFL